MHKSFINVANLFLLRFYHAVEIGFVLFHALQHLPLEPLLLAVLERLVLQGQVLEIISSVSGFFDTNSGFLNHSSKLIFNQIN